MKNIKNEYKGFLDDIEKNIKNKEDLEYVKKRFTAFLDPVLDEINSIIEYKKEEVEELEKRQQEIERKMSKMQSVIDNIEKDIYAEDGFDFEIVCPYCNHEFIIDVDENKTEKRPVGLTEEKNFPKMTMWGALAPFFHGHQPGLPLQEGFFLWRKHDPTS